MKTKFRGITLTAILLSASNMTFAEQGTSSAVGDLPGYGEATYDAQATTDAPSASIQSAGYASGFAGQVEPAHQYVSSDLQSYAPIGVSDLQQVGHLFSTGRGQSSCDCGSCDSGCDSGCSSRRSRFGKILNGCASDTWATVEFLMWFTPDRDMPALVTTSNPGTLPVIPDQGAGNPNNVAIVFGDDIQGEISGGIRGDVGKYVTENVGIGGRFWILADNNDSYFAASDGTNMSIGRPFFNVTRPVPPQPTSYGEDAIFVATTPGPGLTVGFTGEVAANSVLEIWGAEGYGRLKFGCAKNCRLEFIGGYSHFEIKDKLWITSRSVQTTPATAQTTRLTDYFDTRNRFNGGQLGFEMVMTRGRWMARSLTKVHLGNMQQRVRILGNSSVQNPPVASTNFSGGLLALGNQGDYERNVFAFAPEANFKLAYRMRKNVSLSVGYSFIYFDNVELTGDAVDRTIPGDTLLTGAFGTRPAFKFDDSSLWIQGLDLGMVVEF